MGGTIARVVFFGEVDGVDGDAEVVDDGDDGGGVDDDDDQDGVQSVFMSASEPASLWTLWTATLQQQQPLPPLVQGHSTLLDNDDDVHDRDDDDNFHHTKGVHF